MDAVRVVCFHVQRNKVVEGYEGYGGYLSVVNVPNGTDIHVRFCSREFGWSVRVPSPCGN